MIDLAAHLRTAGRKLLLPYVTGGITEDWTAYLLAYQDAGADAIEVGLPFSDPMLDGVTIQEASDRALARGTTIDRILADLSAIRAQVRVPIVAMTYSHLVIRRGPEVFCAALRDAGVSGLIVPDAPLDEVAPIEAAADAAGVALVLLAAPSTAPTRLRDIADRSRGFIYAISVMSTTGERDALAPSASRLAGSLKQLTDLPVMLGFGILSPEQAAAACVVADGVAIGAALMRKVLDGATPDAMGGDLAGIRKGLDVI